jgi:hypothetical protein
MPIFGMPGQWNAGGGKRREKKRGGKKQPLGCDGVAARLHLLDNFFKIDSRMYWTHTMWRLLIKKVPKGQRELVSMEDFNVVAEQFRFDIGRRQYTNSTY